MCKKWLLFSTVVGVVSAVVSAVITASKAGRRAVEPVRVEISDAYIRGTEENKYLVTYVYAGREFEMDVNTEENYKYFKERVGQMVPAFVEYLFKNNGEIDISCHLLGKESVC